MCGPDKICNLSNGARYVSGANFKFIQNDRSAIRRPTKKLKPESRHLVSAPTVLLNFGGQVGLTYRLPRPRCWLPTAAEIRIHRHAGCSIEPASFAGDLAKERVDH
jgi:hypothetical protein